MSTNEQVLLENDVKVECECDWEYERNPGDKEQAQYDGGDDGWCLRSWEVTNGIKLTSEQSVEVEDELTRQGPNI